MELLKKGLDIRRIAFQDVSQALVEGTIPMPEGKTAAKLLVADGSVFVTGCASGEHKVVLSGRVQGDFICLDGNGDIFAFTSSASFKHTIESPTNSQMHAEANCALQSFQTQLSNGEISLSAVIDVECTVIDSSSVSVFAGVAGSDDVIIKPYNITETKTREIGSVAVRLREEMQYRNVSAILSKTGYISVKSVRMEAESAIVEAVLTVSALYLNYDGNPEQLTQNILIAETVPLDEAAENLYATIDMESLVLRPLGEEFAIISVESVVTFHVYMSEKVSYSLPTDAFSKSVGLKAVNSHVTMMLPVSYENKKHTFTEGISVPYELPGIYRPVYASARPVLTGMQAMPGRIATDGLMFVSILYQAEDGSYVGFSEDIPFSADIDCQSDMDTRAMIRLDAVASPIAGGGRKLDVSFTLNLSAELYQVKEVNAMTDAELCDCAPHASGIIAYFAGGGECLFDIAKQFNVIPSCGGKDMFEPMAEGEKMVMFV